MSGSLLGEGTSDFFEQIEYLKSSNYSGWFIYENYYAEKPLRLDGDDQLLMMQKDIKILNKALGI